MAQLILSLIIELIVITPLILIAFNRSEDTWKYLLLFVVYYIFHASLLGAPSLIPALRIIKGTWNWSGKIYAIIGSLLFYTGFRKAFTDHNYITFRQHENTSKGVTFFIIVLFLLSIGLAFFSIHKSEGRLAYFLFQFTMPGLDEELAFRGIMLGLLSNSLRPKMHVGAKNLGNPALLITSILFGLGHSFQIDNNWNFHQNWFEFINTFAIGLLLGWMTIRSGSILRSVLAHNLINTLPKLIFWM